MTYFGPDSFQEWIYQSLVQSLTIYNQSSQCFLFLDGGIIREVSLTVGDRGCEDCWLYIEIFPPEVIIICIIYIHISVIFQGPWCTIITDHAWGGSHPANSVITLTGSNLENCEGWNGNNINQDGWQININFNTDYYDDELTLSDGHIYFSPEPRYSQWQCKLSHGL